MSISDSDTYRRSECPTCGKAFDNERAVDIHHGQAHGFTEQWFWNKANVRGPDDCWEWQGTIHSESNPYGKISVDGDLRRAHRVAHELEKGGPGDLQVNHHCDNPPCVNPRHLYAGTQAENNRDKFERGRDDVTGEENPSNKLDVNEVVEIREIVSRGDKSYRDIACEYDISKTTVYDIVNGNSWNHLK